MTARIEPENTRPILRSTLRELVRETRTREPRVTTRIPRLTLVTLLQEERELSTPIELDAPRPATVEVTERVWRRGSGTAATKTRSHLALAFVSAVIAGLLLTAPFWW
jgi:hypothetical protein